MKEKTLDIFDLARKRCEEIDARANALEEQKSMIDRQLFSLGEEREIVIAILNKIQNNEVPLITQRNVFENKSGRWGKDVVGVFKTVGRLLQTRDLVKILEENPMAAEDKETLRKMSDALNKRIVRKSLKGYKKKGVAGKYYGLPEWFEGSLPKKEYLDAIH